MTLLAASLYILCAAFLFGSAAFIYSRNPHSRLNGYYALLALALLGWVGTLFAFGSLPEGNTLLTVGRANFAAAALVAMASCLFAAELAGRRLMLRRAVWVETAILVALSLGTPLIDRAETVLRGQHTTTYGPLFTLYIVHVVVYLAAAVIFAFRSLPEAGDRKKAQLALVGAGILATAVVGVTADIILPYGYGDFRFINVGPLSTVLFLAAIGYAVFAAHLFSIRVIIRAAFVYAGLITLALELYQLAVSFLAKLLPFGDAAERGLAATAIALIVNAFTQQPVRKWLERVIDRFARRHSSPAGRNINAGHAGRRHERVMPR